MFGPKIISKLTIEPPSPRAERRGVAIAVVARNEAAHIAEWLEFHRKAGVSKFVIYDNGSTDETIAVARSVLSGTELDVVPWDQKLSDGRSGAEIHNQVLAFAHALRNFGSFFRWMAFIDIDEFLVPTSSADIPSALFKLGDAAHVSLPWHMFGRNGHEAAPSGGILSNYTQRARDPLASEHALNWKCIVDPCRVTAVRVHGMEVDGKAEGVNDLGRMAKHKDRGKAEFYSQAEIQLNHYYTRSNEELQAKITRGSNKTVEAQKHLKRVMRIVDAIEKDTIEDRLALDFWSRS